MLSVPKHSGKSFPEIFQQWRIQEIKKNKSKQKERSKSAFCLGLAENPVGKEWRWSAKAGSTFCVNLKSKTPLTKRARSTSGKWSSCCPDGAKLSRNCKNLLCGRDTKPVPHWSTHSAADWHSPSDLIEGEGNVGLRPHRKSSFGVNTQLRHTQNPQITLCKPFIALVWFGSQPRFFVSFLIRC